MSKDFNKESIGHLWDEISRLELRINALEAKQ